MSLDVTLSNTEKRTCSHCGGTGIVSEEEIRYEGNITHNLHAMANAAGIGAHLWSPEEIGITKANQLIEPLEVGLAFLRQEPDKFRAFNPTNGWGTYEDLVGWVQEYLNACKTWADADVRASRRRGRRRRRDRNRGE